MASRATYLRQVAALPWRMKNGRVEILLITSRETRRWVIPKGWPMENLVDHEAAGREAFEEAGVEGRMSVRVIGNFHYEKVMKTGDRSDVAVDVYDLEVMRPLRQWPEKDERKRQWFTAEEAADIVHEPSLKALILKIGRSVAVE
jgi:8-oxo-dGTP pyrophosphatase MutT (NUDIX family)